MIWKARVAPVTVSAPNNQVSPNKNITPLMLIRRRTTVAVFIASSFTRREVEMVCLRRTNMTTANMTVLKRMMAKIGARKAPKKTAVWPIKQLSEIIRQQNINAKEDNCYHLCTPEYTLIITHMWPYLRKLTTPCKYHTCSIICPPFCIVIQRRGALNWSLHLYPEFMPPPHPMLQSVFWVTVCYCAEHAESRGCHKIT